MTLSFDIGPYHMTVFNTGLFALDGGAMYGVVPKVIWEKQTPPDEKNRIPLGLNCMLIQSAGRTLLLETGVGQKFDEKHQRMYGIQETPPLEAHLQSVGVNLADIDTVLFSHLHFDHAGGATTRDADGTLRPTFPNATYWVHEGEWQRAMNPHERSQASYLKENFTPIEAAGQLKLISGAQTEVLPGLRLQHTGGHCAFHQVLILDLPEGGFIYWADLIPTHHHLKIPYVMGYDESPLETMRVKKELLSLACTKGWVNVFEHDTEILACTLQAGEKLDQYSSHPLTNAT